MTFRLEYSYIHFRVVQGKNEFMPLFRASLNLAHPQFYILIMLYWKNKSKSVEALLKPDKNLAHCKIHQIRLSLNRIISSSLKDEKYLNKSNLWVTVATRITGSQEVWKLYAKYMTLCVLLKTLPYSILIASLFRADQIGGGQIAHAFQFVCRVKVYFMGLSISCSMVIQCCSQRWK